MNLPQVDGDSHENPVDANRAETGKAKEVPVYNLVALVRNDASGVSASAANINLDPVSASTMREALSRLVSSAKAALAAAGQQASELDSSLWIDPPREATDGETRFVVPLHL